MTYYIYFLFFYNIFAGLQANQPRSGLTRKNPWVKWGGPKLACMLNGLKNLARPAFFCGLNGLARAARPACTPLIRSMDSKRIS